MNHPVVAAAADGKLPDWSCLTAERREHARRVAQLMEAWAQTLAPAECERWRAAGMLHDALKDAPAGSLRALLARPYSEWAEPLLHAAAAAAMLRAAGVDDPALLLAIAYHPLGHPSFDALGCALYVADYIEPGRTYLPAQLEAWRQRMPHDFAAVAREVTRVRILQQLESGREVRPESTEFWNRQLSAHVA